MPTYTALSNALVAVGAKPFATTVQALRDNPLAIAEGDSTAPIQTAGWHPYNKTMNNGSETGRIWSFAVDGAVAAVTTPDFVDGWEYALLLDRVLSTGGTTQSLNLNLFRQTSGAYAGAVAVGPSNSINNTQSVSGWVELLHLRKTLRLHTAFAQLFPDIADTVGVFSPTLGVTRHTTAQRILRAQITASGGSITGSGSVGSIFLYRRRDPGSQ
ncbi:hypothetical protein Pan4_16 [Pseudanabaena phage Pan4]|nr:hypothetical protein Pan4_16 [Pseudanabaena phage Pan4]